MKRNLHPVMLMALTVLVVSFSTSCKKKSSVTGFNYNDTKWGGFEAHKFDGQATGPNLVLVQGGTVTQGVTEQDVTFEYNNIPRRVTVSSFYMDETEISNLHYREYVYWVTKQFPDFQEVIKNSLPDTLV
jgi:sulfatase modifying factor 1